MIAADIVLALRQRDLYEDARRVARAHNVTLDEMVSRDRHKGPAMARHCFWAELYGRGHWSYQRIADLFGVDHTTVIAGVKAYNGRVAA